MKIDKLDVIGHRKAALAYQHLKAQAKGAQARAWLKRRMRAEKALAQDAERRLKEQEKW